MVIDVEKIPGGYRVDGLDLKNGKCGCTTVLPCCYSWSRVKRSGEKFTYIVKATGPETRAPFTWGYTVRKGGTVVDVTVEDARDKEIFSGYYPPRIEEWKDRGWEIVSQEGARQEGNIWRCAACRWLYKEQEQTTPFADLPDEWTCPVCRTGKGSFEHAG